MKALWRHHQNVPDEDDESDAAASSELTLAPNTNNIDTNNNGIPVDHQARTSLATKQKRRKHVSYRGATLRILKSYYL